MPLEVLRVATRIRYDQSYGTDISNNYLFIHHQYVLHARHLHVYQDKTKEMPCQAQLTMSVTKEKKSLRNYWRQQIA